MTIAPFNTDVEASETAAGHIASVISAGPPDRERWAAIADRDPPASDRPRLFPHFLPRSSLRVRVRPGPFARASSVPPRKGLPSSEEITPGP